MWSHYLADTLTQSHSLTNYYVTGTVLGSRDMAMKTNKVLKLMKST